MKSNVGMAVMKKGQKQDYFSQQSILLILPAYTVYKTFANIVAL